MRVWLSSAAAAARLTSDRAELWIPAALAALGFLGWLPFVIAVVPLPDAGDLAFFAADLFGSGAFPWNVALLVLSLLLVVLTLCLVVSFGEAALQRGLRQLMSGAGPNAGPEAPDTLGGETAVIFVVLLLALLPAALGMTALAVGVRFVAPGEFQSPDIGGPVMVRIALALAPLLGAVVLLALAGQAFGAAVQRRAVGPAAESLGGAVRHGIGDLRRHSRAVVGIVLVTFAALAALLAFSTLLLRTLWTPIALLLDDGDLTSPATILLLVGFVAIWLCLLLAAGALHVWASAWWSLVLQPLRRRPDHVRREEAGIG